MEELIRSLPALLRAAGDSEDVLEAAAIVAWRRVSGEALRLHAVPFRLYRKTLIVAVADTTWQKQLEALSGQMIFGVNSLLRQPVVTFIEFRVDPRTVMEARQAANVKTAESSARGVVPAEVSGPLAEAAEAIADESLRRRFLDAAGRCIERSESN